LVAAPASQPSKVTHAVERVVPAATFEAVGRLIVATVDRVVPFAAGEGIRVRAAVDARRNAGRYAEVERKGIIAAPSEVRIESIGPRQETAFAL
jgi:hypothetical protein